jgi:hypothetical protein
VVLLAVLLSLLSSVDSVRELWSQETKTFSNLFKEQEQTESVIVDQTLRI